MKKCAYCGADLEQCGIRTRCGKSGRILRELRRFPSENGNTSQPYGSPYQANQGYYGGPVPAQ